MPPRRRNRLLSICAVLMAGFSAASFCRSSADDRQHEVATLARDILNRRCFACHGANGVARKNVFVLTASDWSQDRSSSQVIAARCF